MTSDSHLHARRRYGCVLKARKSLMQNRDDVSFGQTVHDGACELRDRSSIAAVSVASLSCEVLHGRDNGCRP
jgi:hypothetical protein